MSDRRAELPNSTTLRRSTVSAALDRLHIRLERSHARTRDFAARYPNTVRGLVALSALFTLFVCWFFYQVFAGLPGKEQLRELKETVEGTTLYDAHDKPLFSIPAQYRVEVPLDRMSSNLRQAIVAVEDVRFYDHDGIDGIRVIGAVITDLRERRAAEGASTITQQLARVSFLTRDKTLRRKVREAILAQRIEQLYGKDEILEIYLNKIYFGDGLYGAEAAARGYFGKPASDLTLAEAAMLAGIVKAPSAANPTVSMERAIERRNIVLKLMREHRFIDQAAHDAAREEKVVLHDTLRRDDPGGLHFKEVVRRQLIDTFGKETVYKERLRVYTTIDPAMQRAAEEAVTATLREIEPRIPIRDGEPLQGSLFALDPATGEVRAIVGGRDVSSVGLNRAMQAKRQPGSAFKPFVYAAALESGYSPASVITQLNQPVDTYEGAWLPEDEHSSAASMTMRTALRTSSNRAAVRVLEDVGIERAVSHANRLGVGTVPNVPSIALGSGEVTLASMTSAYAAFAQGGIVREPYVIKRVEDQDGTVLFESDPKPRRTISESTAFLMASMLADVIDTGTAIGARSMGFRLPAAGKTGTTNDFVDAWFVGFTPKLVAGVWIGFDRPRTIVKDGYAGLLAVPMWTRFMKAATAADPDTWFAPPRDIVAVEVCRLSGRLPGVGCRTAASIGSTGEITYKSMVYTDYFVRGRDPVRTCDSHTIAYPEPYFAVTAFDSLPALIGMERVIPDPMPALVQPAPYPPTPYPPPAPYAPVSVLPIPAPPKPAPMTSPQPVEYSTTPAAQRRLTDLPAAPPEAKPESQVPSSPEDLAPSLPPPEPVEALPQ
jgi:penicillin-binding protein 1A